MYFIDFTIAWSIFGADGIVLDIKNSDSAATFMNANYWSCYVNEGMPLYCLYSYRMHIILRLY